MTDDVYRNLPPDLLTALRDPRTVLPGEQAVYERVGAWTARPVLADTARPVSTWVEFRTPVQLTGPGGERAD